MHDMGAHLTARHSSHEAGCGRARTRMRQVTAVRNAQCCDCWEPRLRAALAVLALLDALTVTASLAREGGCLEHDDKKELSQSVTDIHAPIITVLSARAKTVGRWCRRCQNRSLARAQCAGVSAWHRYWRPFIFIFSAQVPRLLTRSIAIAVAVSTHNHLTL